MRLARFYLIGFVCSGFAGCSTCEGDPPRETIGTEEEGPRSGSGDHADVTIADPDVPGVGRIDRALVRRLTKALTDRGADYEPRTEHLESSGAPTFTNRLILETSPYLLQHAHNPVNWFPWREEAFARARAEDKPIFLSVGYSTCHWCHVMERESFEDEEIAAYINRHFIPIKVDREERPDVDDVYMRAVQMLTGRGGWPMTVVMTPDRQPFFGGTYFPPRDGVRGARRGLMTILRDLVRRYAEEREGVVSQAASMSTRIAQASQPARPGTVPGPEVITNAARQLASSFDATWGGFGRAPKFPQPSRVMFLLRYLRRTNDAEARRMLVTTLDKMWEGGMYDHVGGGFHRYSTDAQWLVPHFEKMLYDNAQLAEAYVEAWQLTGEDRFAAVARDVLDYVAREMISDNGGFYSATDADSMTPSGHREEGWFFTWTPAEVSAVVGPERARIAAAVWSIRDGGNFEGRSILHRPRPLATVVAELRSGSATVTRELAAIRTALYDARARRPPPLRDDKLLTGWNGLMISAFARAALAFDDERYAGIATRAAITVLDNLRRDDGRLMRSYMDGRAANEAVLDDYAALIQALLDLYECTWGVRWIRDAVRLQRLQDEHYADAENGGYFMTAHDAEELLARDKPSYDGAIPSGNSISLLNLVRLAEVTGNDEHRERAERGFGAFANQMRSGPTSMPMGLVALDHYLDTPLEVVIVHPEGRAPDALLSRARRTFLPNAFVSVVSPAGVEEQVGTVPVLEGKVAIGGAPTAYVCERGRCELPTGNPATFARQIARVRPLLDEGQPTPLRPR